MRYGKIHNLQISWGVSRGRATYGYNICRLNDSVTRARYRCKGGGYDMIGTVFGEWLQNTYQEKLLALVKELMKDPDNFSDCGYSVSGYIKFKGLYGMTYNTNTDIVSLDGACGIESMRYIAEAIGAEVQWVGSRKGSTQAYMVGFIEQ